MQVSMVNAVDNSRIYLFNLMSFLSISSFSPNYRKKMIP